MTGERRKKGGGVRGENPVPGDVRRTFAFSYKHLVPLPQDGYHFYDPLSEFKRLGFDEQNRFGKLFRVSHANVPNYALCPTYPRSFVVPAVISEDHLIKIAEFRSQNRIPATVYLDHRTGASLSRSSLPSPPLLLPRPHKRLSFSVALSPWRACPWRAFVGSGARKMSCWSRAYEKPTPPTPNSFTWPTFDLTPRLFSMECKVKARKISSTTTIRA